MSREHVMDAIRVWLGTIAPHLNPEECVAACVASLGAGRRIAVLRCPECTALHLDSGVYATRKHTVHVCNKCSHRYRTAPASQGNPLGVLSPVLREGKLFISRLPTAVDRAPQGPKLLSLAVEPTFLGSLAEHTRTTDDPAFVSLRNRAGGIDGTYRMVNVSGFRVVERTSLAGKQLVVPPGGGLRQLLLQDVHSAGHFGFKRTLSLLQ